MVANIDLCVLTVSKAHGICDCLYDTSWVYRGNSAVKRDCIERLCWGLWIK